MSLVDTKGRMIAEKFAVINDFCKQSEIDRDLRTKMKKALEYRSKNYVFALLDNHSLIDSLPPNLIYEVDRTLSMA